MGKKVATIQSNYIPWKGYFDIINMVDEFILYDDAQYTKNDWRNRNKIKTQNGVQWITIPVREKHRLHKKIKDIEVQDSLWTRKHWKTICQNYSKAAYFTAYGDLFEELYMGMQERFLSQINYRFIKTICDILGIRTTISWTMDYRLVEGKTEPLVDLCQQAGAKEYISGPSAKSYINERLFSENGIKLTWMDYSGYPEYRQLYPPFEHAVSIIDLILNEGPNATRFMKSF